MRRVELSETARRIAHVLLLLTCLRAGVASAASPAPIELVWTAPRGCSSADDVRARVRTLIADRETVGTALRADATITRRAEGTLRLRLIVRVGELVGERNIVGKSCDDLAGSAAIALALLLRSDDPRGGERSGAADARSKGPKGADERRAVESTSTVTPTPAASPPPPPPAPLARASAPALPPLASAPRRVHGLVRAPSGVLGFGPLRRASFGLALTVGVVMDRWSLEAEGRLRLPTEVTTTRQAERFGADVDHYTAALRGCRALVGTRVELAPCLSLSVEHIAARGTGRNIAKSEAAATWLAAGVGAQARLHVLRWLRLVGGFDLQFQTARPTVVIDGVGRIAKLLPVAFSVTFGPEWIL